MTSRILSTIALLSMALSATSRADDWSQWRGKDRIGHSPDTGLLKTWPEGGPKRVWMFKDCGIGYSGPAVAGGKVFIMGTRDDVSQLIALDEKTGKELWAVDIDAVYPNKWGNGPRATPTVDGEKVYAMSGKGTLICANAADGKEVWKKKMKDLGGKMQSWGYTESVLIDGEHVVCTPGGEKGAIAMLDKATGELVWQSKDLKDDAQYSSPIIVEHDGKKQYVQLFSKTLAGVSADDGSVVWKTSFPGRVAVIPTPIHQDGHVYVTAGYKVGCKQVKLSGSEPELIYENKNMSNHHGGVILVDGHLYGHSDMKKSGGWMCQNFKSGEVIWADTSLGKGAVGYADGMLYCLSEKDGSVVLADASPKGWKEHGRFKLDPQTELRKPDGRIWTHPVIINGHLFLRDQDLVYCYDVKG